MHSEWLQWYTLIFTLPAALSIILLLLIGVGSLDTEEAAGADDGGGADMDADLDVGMDAAMDVSVSDAYGLDSGDADMDADGYEGEDDGDDDTAAEGGHGGFHFGQGVRAVLGIGRAPLTIGGGALLLGWGITGLVAMQWLRPPALSPEAFLPVAALIAFLGATLFARVISRLYLVMMPKSESASIPRESLVGSTGEVIFPISATAGRIHIWDQHRTLHQEPARVRPGQAEIPRGRSVLILEMDAQTGAFLVDEVPSEAAIPGL